MRVIKWYLTTSAVIGAPILLVLMLCGFERLVATLACDAMQMGCDRSYLHQTSYIFEQVEQGKDVVAKRK